MGFNKRILLLLLLLGQSGTFWVTARHQEPSHHCLTAKNYGF